MEDGVSSDDPAVSAAQERLRACSYGMATPRTGGSSRRASSTPGSTSRRTADWRTGCRSLRRHEPGRVRIRRRCPVRASARDRRRRRGTHRGRRAGSLPIRALTVIIQYGAYLILVVYLLTVIAALVLVWRRGRRPISLAILTLGVLVLVLGYVLRDTFSPLPAGPFGAVALAALAAPSSGSFSP